MAAMIRAPVAGRSPNPLEGEEFLLRIFDSFADPLAVYDRDYRILKINQALIRFYQRSAEQLLENHCYEIFHGRSAVCSDCHVKKVFRTGKPRSREMLISLPDGSQRYFEVNAYPMKDAAGATIQVLEWSAPTAVRPRWKS